MPDDESEACYFSDGKRRVDYVIVTDDAYSFSVMDFLESLNDKQLDYEIVAGQVSLMQYMNIAFNFIKCVFVFRK